MSCRRYSWQSVRTTGYWTWCSHWNLERKTDFSLKAVLRQLYFSEPIRITQAQLGALHTVSYFGVLVKWNAVQTETWFYIFAWTFSVCTCGSLIRARRHFQQDALLTKGMVLMWKDRLYFKVFFFLAKKEQAVKKVELMAWIQWKGRAFAWWASVHIWVQLVHFLPAMSAIKGQLSSCFSRGK